MKKTRKLFAGLTALCLTGTMLSALPVNAVSDYQPEEFFLLSSKEGMKGRIEHFTRTGHILTHEYLLCDTLTDYSYGDVLEITGYSRNPYNQALVFDADTKITTKGTASEVFETKKLTVIDADCEMVWLEDEQWDDYIGIFRLTDADNNVYSYVQDYGRVDYGINLQTAQVGDSYTFAVLDYTALLPLENQEQPDSDEPSVNNSYDYAVIGTDNAENPEYYVLIDNDGDTWYTVSGDFETPLSVGDTITIQNAMIAVTNIEGTNDLMISPQDGYQVQKTGSILDNPQTAEFTVQEIQTGSSFGDGVYLEKDGTQYRIFTDWIEKNYAEYSYLDWESVSVGDTVTCVLYENYPVLGIEPDASAETPVNSSYDYAVIGTDNAENPNKYVLIDSGGDTWYTSSRNFETPLSVGDTITIQNAMMGVTNIEGTNDLYIEPEEGYQVQKTGSFLETPKTAEFTVQKIQTGSPFGDRVYLEKDGTQYHIFTDWIERNYAEYSYLDWEAVSVGDTVTCMLYDDYPVLGIEKTPETVPDLTGDADGSGKLDILDVIVINKAILGKEKLEDSRITCIDFNGNGKPDAEDTLIMMKKIVGLL